MNAFSFWSSPTMPPTPGETARIQIEEKIFSSTNYAVLTKDAQKVIFDYVQSPNLETRPHFNFTTLYRQRQSLADAIAQGRRRLGSLNPASFNWLTDAQKVALAQELYFYFYVFSAQFELDKLEDRAKALPELSENIKLCADRLNELRETLNEGDPSREFRLTFAYSEQPVKYLGATIIAPIVIETIDRLTAGGVTEAMSYINGIRLYWVWGRSFLDTVFTLLGPSAISARERLALPVPITGYMSFVLYFARGAIALGLFLKHVTPGPWMSGDEAQIPWMERVATQWRKYHVTILNDWIWGFANMACFLWLIGSLGPWGDALTSVLLLMDVTITGFRFWGEQADYVARIQRCKYDITSLEDAIRIETDTAKKEILEIHLHQAQKNKKDIEQEWEDKYTNLCYDLVYSISLLVAFCAMCSLFPHQGLPDATMTLINIIGTVSCFGLTLAYTALTGHIAVQRAASNSMTAQTEHDTLIDKIAEKLQNTDSADEERKNFELRQLYLQHLSLKAESLHQKDVYAFQQMQLIQSTALNLISPVFIFAALMFLPYATSLGVIAGVVSLGLVWSKMFESYAPEATAQVKFDEKGYDDFINSDLDRLKFHR